MLRLIPFPIWYVDIACFLWECSKDERRKESFKSVSNNHLNLNGFWLYHHAQWLHKDQPLWMHVEPFSGHWHHSNMNYFNRMESPRISPWIPVAMWKGPVPKAAYLWFAVFRITIQQSFTFSLVIWGTRNEKEKSLHMEGFSSIIENIFRIIIMEHSSSQRLDKKNADLITMRKI